MRQGYRWRRTLRWACLLALGSGLVAACVPVAPPPPPPPPPPTRGSTFPPGLVPSALTAISPPPGATAGGTSEWYRAPAPGGRAVVLGVYRPTVTSSVSPVTALVLHGNDGYRRHYESVAARFAGAGMIGIVGCWFDRPEQLISDAPDAISCSNGPIFKGGQGGVPDLDALVAAADQINEVDASRLVAVGHSYGATVALDRAATGAPQPVISTSGLLARDPPPLGPPAPGDQLPADPPKPSQITVPVMLAHGTSDPIVPIGQAYVLASLLTAAGHPPATRYYPAPADHSFPFTAPYDGWFIADATSWIATLAFPTSVPDGSVSVASVPDSVGSTSTSSSSSSSTSSTTP